MQIPVNKATKKAIARSVHRSDLEDRITRLRAALTCIGILNASGGHPDPEIDKTVREAANI